ncbi:hypothetical protein BDQ17DRAFT_508505 [Cyathus striatus]|nr:hypothetical protein BDQ17DRAFT_508505 [Cyathus striatus]
MPLSTLPLSYSAHLYATFPSTSPSLPFRKETQRHQFTSAPIPYPPAVHDPPPQREHYIRPASPLSPIPYTSLSSVRGSRSYTSAWRRYGRFDSSQVLRRELLLLVIHGSNDAVSIYTTQKQRGVIPHPSLSSGPTLPLTHIQRRFCLFRTTICLLPARQWDPGDNHPENKDEFDDTPPYHPFLLSFLYKFQLPWPNDG